MKKNLFFPFESIVFCIVSRRVNQSLYRIQSLTLFNILTAIIRVIFLGLFFTLLPYIPTSFAAPTSKQDIVYVQLRWHHQFQFAGYYAAIEKGFYKDEGIDVRVRIGDPDHQPVSEVLSGQAQYAEGNSEVLYQRLQGKLFWSNRSGHLDCG